MNNRIIEMIYFVVLMYALCPSKELHRSWVYWWPIWDFYVLLCGFFFPLLVYIIFAFPETNPPIFRETLLTDLH